MITDLNFTCNDFCAIKVNIQIILEKCLIAFSFLKTYHHAFFTGVCFACQLHESLHFPAPNLFPQDIAFLIHEKQGGICRYLASLIERLAFRLVHPEFITNKVFIEKSCHFRIGKYLLLHLPARAAKGCRAIHKEHLALFCRFLFGGFQSAALEANTLLSEHLESAQ